MWGRFATVTIVLLLGILIPTITMTYGFDFGFGPSFLANGTNFLDEPDKPDLRLQEFSLASWFKTSHNAVGANSCHDCK